MEDQVSEYFFGRRLATEILSSKREIEKVWFLQGAKGIQSLVQQVEEKRIPYQWVTRSKLDQLAGGGNHQGIIIRTAAYAYATLDDVLNRVGDKLPFLLILDGIQDPYNLGSILRVADATGVHGVIIPKRRSVGLTSIVAKTSSGAIEYVPVVRVSNIVQVIEELKKRNLWIVGTDMGGTSLYHQIDYDMPLAIVMGGEGSGISRLVKEHCDFVVKLPMMGQVSSLNASVAAGVMMYEVLRKRQGGAE